jgi:beta-glucanase (GH16 family)
LAPIYYASVFFLVNECNNALLAASSASTEKWSLVWSDEFDKDGAPDPAKWDYEPSTYGTGWIREGESQYHTTARRENARVENGLLVLEARKEEFTTATGRQASYTSASLVTKGRASWRYGRIEVRAKLPRGTGTWPAIWMLGDSFGGHAEWPMCGEIDIMEHVGKEPEHIYSTIHYGASREEHTASKQGLFSKPDLYSDFHVYAVEWNENRLDFFVDDSKYHSIDLAEAGVGPDNAFRHPFFLLLTLTIGGPWGGPLIDDGIFPAKFLVDYVRVYQQPLLSGEAARLSAD